MPKRFFRPDAEFNATLTGTLNISRPSLLPCFSNGVVTLDGRYKNDSFAIDDKWVVIDFRTKGFDDLPRNADKTFAECRVRIKGIGLDNSAQNRCLVALEVEKVQEKVEAAA